MAKRVMLYGNASVTRFNVVRPPEPTPGRIVFDTEMIASILAAKETIVLDSLSQLAEEVLNSKGK